MESYEKLLQNNKAWAADMVAKDPQFFSRLVDVQHPEFLWIGCSDSRVPANEVTGTLPGQIFVHRNISNVVVHTDFNCLSVLQFAVDVLHVTDVIVCGHYGCGGIRAALDDKRHGLIDNWLRHIKDVYVQHEGELNDPKLDPEARVNRFCELNVKAQVANLCATTVVQEAWARGDELAIHGWIYGLGDGLLKDLGVCITALDQLPSIYRMKSAKAG